MPPKQQLLDRWFRLLSQAHDHSAVFRESKSSPLVELQTFAPSTMDKYLSIWDSWMTHADASGFSPYAPPHLGLADFLHTHSKGCLGSLRWADAQWVPPASLQFHNDTLLGQATRTKTTSRSMPFGLYTGGLLVEALARTKANFPSFEPDFLVCEIGPGPIGLFSKPQFLAAEVSNGSATMVHRPFGVCSYWKLIPPKPHCCHGHASCALMKRPADCKATTVDRQQPVLSSCTGGMTFTPAICLRRPLGALGRYVLFIVVEPLLCRTLLSLCLGGLQRWKRFLDQRPPSLRRCQRNQMWTRPPLLAQRTPLVQQLKIQWIWDHSMRCCC